MAATDFTDCDDDYHRGDCGGAGAHLCLPEQATWEAAELSPDGHADLGDARHSNTNLTGKANGAAIGRCAMIKRLAKPSILQFNRS